MFGIDHFDIQPDLLTMARGITSGYVPLGAFGCTDAVMAPIENFFHLHTYGNHLKTMGWALEFAPPLIITKEDIDEALAVLDQCISEEEKEMGF